MRVGLVLKVAETVGIAKGAIGDFATFIIKQFYYPEALIDERTGRAYCEACAKK